MPRRKSLPPDTCLSWRDPNMPVLGKSGRPIPHEKMVVKATLAMELTNEPTWRNDPTYNLRKDRK
jgi:hypothetical protein